MSKKNKYTDLVNQMKEKIKSSGATRYSESDRTALTKTLVNTPDYEMDVYVQGNDSEIEVVSTTPVKDYRESLKPVLKQFGVDDAETDRINEIEFPTAHAKAFNALADAATHGYLDTGRKMVLLPTSKTESQMEFSKVEKAEKREETRKPVEVAPGEYKSVPTGKRNITAPHTEIKASNKIPPWLVTKEDV